MEIAHPDAVSALAFSPDSRLLATGSVDGSTRLIQIVDGRVVAIVDNGPGVRGKVAEPGSTVKNLKFSPNGRYLGISGEFPRAQLIPLTLGLGEEAFVSHAYAVRAIDFSSDSQLFASGDAFGVATLIALQKPTETTSISVLSGISSLAFGPQATLFIGDDYGGVTTFQTAGTRRAVPFNPHPSQMATTPNTVVAIAFSSDHTYFAVGHLDGAVQLMKVDGWNLVKEWQPNSAELGGCGFRSKWGSDSV